MDKGNYALTLDILADRMASIDEEDECDIIYEKPPSSESLKRWKQYGKVQQKLDAVREEPEAFQSETTLVQSKGPSLNEIPTAPAEKDLFASLKSRISRFLEKPIEKLYGKPAKIEKVKPEEHKKSHSLLERLSVKFQHLKTNEVAPESPVKSDSGDSLDQETEYLNSVKQRRQFEQKYKIIREIGAGGHSTVFLAEKQTDHSVVVCKFIKKTSVWRWYKDPYSNSRIPFEIFIMKQFTMLKNENVIKYLEHFSLGQGKFVIVMEFLGEEWCDLYDYVEKYGPVKQDHSREIFRQVVKTIEWMHWNGFLHNDIKDENIMINMKTRKIKLIDFGSCSPIVPGKNAKLFYGTKKFAAPEALENDSYDPERQEVWALGTLLYVLVFKMDPFKTDQDILETNIQIKIQRLRISGYNSVTPIDISDDCVDAMLAMLHKDPKQRISLHQIKNLEFLQNQ